MFTEVILEGLAMGIMTHGHKTEQRDAQKSLQAIVSH